MISNTNRKVIVEELLVEEELLDVVLQEEALVHDNSPI
jgi:hypothetical protein